MFRERIGYLFAFAVCVSYFFSPEIFAWANVITFIPLTWFAVSRRAYPNAFISLFFGLAAIIKIIGA